MAHSISVVTVTLNAEKDLPGLLESLRAQTDRDFEFVVIDGASRDRTLDIITSAGDLVTYMRSEPDFGFFDALNKAVRAVGTDYYLVMGADDALNQDAIANMKLCAAETEADMVVMNVMAGSRILSGYHPKMRWRGPGAMFTSHSVGTLFRTDLHKRFGYYSLKYSIFGDSLFMKRVAISTDTNVVSGKFIAGTFCTEGGFSSSNFVRSICELWMMQRETGESPLVQYLLFQLRLLRHIGRVTARCYMA